jgi:ATP-dependent Lon protease
MTGEISLQGFVLPVGGIKEKCLAAVRNKIKKVILPSLNQPDVDELPQETKNNLEIILVKNIYEVIDHAFDSDTFIVGNKPTPKF